MACSYLHGKSLPFTPVMVPSGPLEGDPIVEGYSSEYNRVRYHASESLAQIGGEHTVKSLIRALDNENADIRWGSAWTLGEIGDRQAVSPLIKMLNDKSDLVRRYAASALGKIEKERFRYGIPGIPGYTGDSYRYCLHT